MGILKPISKYDKRSKGMYVTADRLGRLTLSAELQKEIDHTAGMPLYLYFDDEDRRIGISKAGLKEQTPYVFDKRAYATAGDFLERCGIDTSVQPIRFLYEGVERGIMTFHQIGVKKPQTFKQEKNGNLELVSK